MTVDGTEPSDGAFVSWTGTVAAFDADEGLGLVKGQAGGSWQFHCTAITDGSRQIPIGADVTFAVGPGGPGRWEAFQITHSVAAT